MLPAASQFEKPEATFFNLEFPHNTFHLRHRLLEPLDGHACPSRRSGRGWCARSASSTTPSSSRCGARPARAASLRRRRSCSAVGANPTLGKVLPFVLYETLGPTLPEGLAGAAALWGLAQKAAMAYPDAVRRAGHADGNALFEAILSSRSGVTFTVHEYEDDFALITHADHKIALEMPEMLDEIRALSRRADRASPAPSFPIVLSAGERRAYTANDIFRDPTWRKRDADGALRVSVEDAEALGLVDGGRARITTAAGSAEATVEISEAMLPGHVSLPNGFGLDYVDGDGRCARPRRGAERADLDRLARRLRRHAVAQARAGPASRRCPR